VQTDTRSPQENHALNCVKFHGTDIYSADLCAELLYSVEPILFCGKYGENMIYVLMSNLAFILQIFMKLIITALLSEQLLSTFSKQFGRKI